MGQKVHPYSFRLGVNKGWKSKWFSSKNYAQYLIADQRIKKLINTKLAHGAIADVIIERSAGQITINIHTARPGIIIGRGGTGIDELKKDIQKIVSNQLKLQLNIVEVRQPDIVATLVAQNIASQIEKRFPYKRAIKQAIERAMQSKAQGIKVLVKGRLNNVDIARREKFAEGKIPLHTIRADIDYSSCAAYTTNAGKIGIKVWIYKGEVFGGEKEEAENGQNNRNNRSDNNRSRNGRPGGQSYRPGGNRDNRSGGNRQNRSFGRPENNQVSANRNIQTKAPKVPKPAAQTEAPKSTEAPESADQK